MKPINIAGSGPSGLSAAITLATAGYKVDVYERNRDVGMRFSGDLQGLENWSYHENVLADLSSMGIEVNFDCDPFHELTVTTGTKTAVIKGKQPLFYLVKRGAFQGSLDQGLKVQAVAAGARLRFGTWLDPNEADIIATGPILSKLVAIDKGIIFKTSAPDMALGLANNDAAYKGYSYLLITKGSGCMCTVLFDRLANVASCWETTKRMFAQMVKFDIRDEQSVGGVGSFVMDNVWERERHKYVGEAAGLQDFLWGFGIRNAITSGWLAAQSMIHHTNYEKLARRHFHHRSKAGMVNRYLWEKFGTRQYTTVVKRLQNAHNQQRLLRSFYNFNWMQRLLYSFAFQRIASRYPKVTAK